MKLSSIDYEALERAADVADAQRELLQRWERRSRGNSSTVLGRAVLAGLVTLALASLLTLTSLA
jgi:hypothetical protein